ncbi:hypothetical protein FISHEDRAFT_73308 [Fistulina hepatica ATCC 64428]|uniref:PH domain-containing protein n=1 Tax=Fistulina hepatica ATCC 64428 TaxID=1128425 RepID=A0A0D7ACW9_9AGAR|nr:hypothetical protein FISHEDRAFT_73308 [Fistulina hepatica ATCC 64428]
MAGIELPAMPDFSDYSGSDIKFRLQTLLDNKEKQLQYAGSLGQRVLAQQAELESRIRQLQDHEDQHGDVDDPDVQQRYQELAETIQAWDDENSQLSSIFSGHFLNPSGLNGSTFLQVTPRETRASPSTASPANAPSSAAQSRRAKNAAHRADDVEFAFEIGSGLLTEVRRLQSLLAERDKFVGELREEKEDLEKTIEGLRGALEQAEKGSDKYREENWNLEVALQELRSQLSDAQSLNTRLESEQKRLNKQLTAARDTSDQQKNECDRITADYEALKAKHETDIAQARKHAAGLARDKSDLQQTVDALKAEAQKASRRLPRFGSPLTPNKSDGGNDFLTPGDRDDDLFSLGTGGLSTNRRRGDPSAVYGVDGFDEEDYDQSPEVSPLRLAPNNPTNEIEALQQRLAHAQRQINTLKASLQREKEMRIKLASPMKGGANEDFEDFADEEEGQEEGPSSTSKPRVRVTPYRVGRGRGRGIRIAGRGRTGLTVSERLAQAAGEPDEDVEDSMVHGEQEGDGSRNSMMSVASRDSIVSVEGMDPMFANVLKRRTSGNAFNSDTSLNRSLSSSSMHRVSSLTGGSPLRHSILRGSIRGRRRGAGRPTESRPTSLVGQPEVLGDLGEFNEENADAPTIGEVAIFEEGDMPTSGQYALDDLELSALETVETAEMAIQCDPEPVVEPVAVTSAETQTAVKEPEPLPPAKEYGDMAIQSEPIPEREAPRFSSPPPPLRLPTPPLPVETAEVSMQTSPIASPVIGLGLGLPPTSALIDQTRRTTVTQADISMRSVVSGDMTLQGVDDEDDAPTEMGESDIEYVTDTELGETDMDDYQDARSAVQSRDDLLTSARTSGNWDNTDDYLSVMTSPAIGVSSSASGSREDFRSVMTMSDRGYSDSDADDGESIKASSLAFPSARPSGELERPASVVDLTVTAVSSANRQPLSVETNVVQYATSATSPIVDSPVVEVMYDSKSILVEEPATPKPILKEISIQTDEWIPPVPVTAPAPVSAVSAGLTVPTPASPTSSSVPSSPGLFRVGGSPAQQFQFITAPPQINASSPDSKARDSGAPSVLRDTGNMFGRTSIDNQRRSTDSAASSITDENHAIRARVQSSAPMGIVDKTRPPMMSLPPPPKAPPPPNSMPPPSFIPERRFPSTVSSHEIPPPRPSSPPPPELIQRATTPTFGSVLFAPGAKGHYNRTHGSSMPPLQQGLRQLPSTSSFVSAANAAAAFSIRDRERRGMSSTSLASERSVPSPRSSMSSDRHAYGRIPTTPNKPTTRVSSMGVVNPATTNAPATDPAIIHAITQTMIGEYLYKYTRRAIGKGHGERRHRRFFWVHPYTKTLYWSSADPGSSNVSESSAKSAYIEGVRSVLDPNPMPPGLYQYSLIVSTPAREMKFTAPTKDRHDIWLNALNYLLSRPSPVNMTGREGDTTTGPQSPKSVLSGTDDDHRPDLQMSPQSQRSGRSLQAGTWNTTPRGQRSRSQLSMRGSVGKRSGTPAAEYLRWNGPDSRWNGPDSPYSPTKSLSFEGPSFMEPNSFIDVPNPDDEDLDFELHGDSLSENGFEGLENVRACCDGRHTVGHSAKGHQHHHPNPFHSHHDHDDPAPSAIATISQRLEAPSDTVRPSSPSAWSFRSRSGSTVSRGDVGSLFLWGRGDDGKLRFGSKRSTRPVPAQDP